MIAMGMELKLSVTSDQVDSSIAEIKKQNNIDDDQLREALRAQGMSMANYRADLKRQLRTLSAQTVDELLIGLRRIQASTRSSKIAGWFRHCIKHPHLN